MQTSESVEKIIHKRATFLAILFYFIFILAVFSTLLNFGEMLLMGLKKPIENKT